MAHEQTLRLRRLWLFIGWMLVATVCYLSLTPKPPKIDIEFSDKISHFIAYASMMGWFAQVYFKHQTRLFYALGFICMGVAIEFLQGLGPTRLFEYADMLANTAGVLVAFLITRNCLHQGLVMLERKLLRK